MAEPSKLWEISRRVGITCRLDEQEVVQEYSCLKARDMELMKSIEEGNVRKDGFKLEGGELFKGVLANFSKLE